MKTERIDWPNAAKIALSIVVNVEEGSEMTVARGARVWALLRDVAVDAGAPEGRAARFAALSAGPGLSVSPCAGPAARVESCVV